MHYAVMKSNIEIIKILMARSGLKVNLKNNEGKRPIDLTDDSNKMRIGQLIETYSMN